MKRKKANLVNQVDQKKSQQIKIKKLIEENIQFLNKIKKNSDSNFNLRAVKDKLSAIIAHVHDDPANI